MKNDHCDVNDLINWIFLGKHRKNLDLPGANPIGTLTILHNIGETTVLTCSLNCIAEMFVRAKTL